MDISFILTLIIPGLAIGGIYALVAAGITLIFSVMKVPNFAHGELYMLGAYVTFTILSFVQVGFALAALGAAFVVGCVGLFFERLFRRFYGDMDALIFLGIGLIYLIDNVATFVWTSQTRNINTGFQGTSVGVSGATIGVDELVILSSSVAITACLYLFVHKTRIGKMIRATSEDSEVAQLMGINPRLMYPIVMFIAAMIASFAGSLVGARNGLYPTMGGLSVVQGFIVVTLGGLGSIIGALCAGLLLGIAENAVAIFFPGGVRIIFSMMVLIVVLMIRPNGLFGQREVT